MYEKDTESATKEHDIIRILDEMKNCNVTVHDILRHQGMAADVLSVEDVDDMLNRREMVLEPPLTRDEKLDILDEVKEAKMYNASKGMDWDIVEDAVLRLFEDRIV